MRVRVWRGRSEERIEEALTGFLEKARSGVFEAEIAQMEAKCAEDFRTQHPICCFSPEQGNAPMWSYYADSHTGVCVSTSTRLLHPSGLRGESSIAMTSRFYPCRLPACHLSSSCSRRC